MGDQHGAYVHALAPHGVGSIAGARTRAQPQRERDQAQQLKVPLGDVRLAAQLACCEGDVAPICRVATVDALCQPADGALEGSHDGSTCRRAKAIRAFAANREASRLSNCCPAVVSR